MEAARIKGILPFMQRDLHPRRVAIKKALGRCLRTSPNGHGAYAPSKCYAVLPRCLRPVPIATKTGPLFMLHPGRDPEYQIEDRQQRQDNKASHAANLLYPQKREFRRAGRGEGNRVTLCYKGLQGIRQRRGGTNRTRGRLRSLKF